MCFFPGGLVNSNYRRSGIFSFFWRQFTYSGAEPVSGTWNICVCVCVLAGVCVHALMFLCLGAFSTEIMKDALIIFYRDLWNISNCVSFFSAVGINGWGKMVLWPCSWFRTQRGKYIDQMLFFHKHTLKNTYPSLYVMVQSFHCLTFRMDSSALNCGIFCLNYSTSVPSWRANSMKHY